MRRQLAKSGATAVLRRNLLEWYEANRRDLPWRRTADPYAIWVSEIMLQQTRVAVVVERFQAFLMRFPTIESLARAPEEDVLALWSGLGYYRRARMLHKAARQVVSELGGNLPACAAELRKLPGIGAYTAAAIASIAYGEPVAVVDGNVERVLCRLAHWEASSRGLPLKRKMEQLAAELVDPIRPGDFNQALMELGATVCLPRNPQCESCPLHKDCKTRGEHKTRPRSPMSSREAAYALVVRDRPRNGTRRASESREVLLQQRPASQTVMPGMWEMPALRSAQVPAREAILTVRHSIMQVNYTVRIFQLCEAEFDELTLPAENRRWVGLSELAGMAMTGLARKVLLRAELLTRPQGI